MGWDAKVCEIINDNQWSWPHRDQFWKEVSRETPINFKPQPFRIDDVIWIHNRSGDFYSRIAFELLRSRSVEVRWHKVVWAKGMVPRPSFYPLAGNQRQNAYT